MKLNATVCELPNEPTTFEQAWDGLCSHCLQEGSDLVLLPEMPFSSWLSDRSVVDEAAWRKSVAEHDAWMKRLPELGAKWVASSRPVVRDGRAFNEGYLWSRELGIVGGHCKRNLPNEPGFWEATWYLPGEGGLDVLATGELTAGFAICTELWFFDRARGYGEQSVQLVLCPRATLEPSKEKWLAGGRASATVSGAFNLSSNFSGPSGVNDGWGGLGWIIEPEEGEVLGVTSQAEPFLTRKIDLKQADEAKKSYPRYVEP